MNWVGNKSSSNNRPENKWINAPFLQIIYRTYLICATIFFLEQKFNKPCRIVSISFFCKKKKTITKKCVIFTQYHNLTGKQNIKNISKFKGNRTKTTTVLFWPFICLHYSSKFIWFGHVLLQWVFFYYQFVCLKIYYIYFLHAVKGSRQTDVHCPFG